VILLFFLRLLSEEDYEGVKYRIEIIFNVMDKACYPIFFSEFYRVTDIHKKIDYKKINLSAFLNYSHFHSPILTCSLGAILRSEHFPAFRIKLFECSRNFSLNS
jgi:hypothetical protein